MDERQKRLVRNVLKYKTSRAYFGKLTAANMDYAYGMLRRTQDLQRPMTSAYVRVGQIDASIICRALWFEMSYNPLRFGNVSPFLHNGRENIYRFCDKPLPQDTPGFEILDQIRGKLIGYMNIMPTSNGGWNPDINAQDGWVKICLVNGHSDDMYKKLTKLREIIHAVTTQNIKDFNRKAYRTEMLKVINLRHPKGSRGNESLALQSGMFVNAPQQMTPEEIAEDRLDKAEESAQITIDNSQYVSQAQAFQAQQDLIMCTKMRDNEQSK